MDHVECDELPVYDPRYQAGLEVSHFNDGLQAAPPNPAGLEVRPVHGLILSRDDERMSKTEVSQITHRPRMYCGMSTKTVWIVLVVLVLVVIAIAVGVGVGVSKHSASLTTSPPPNSTTSIKPTSSTTVRNPASSTTTTSPASATPTNGGCQNGTTYMSSNNTPFREICNTNFGTGQTHNTTAADWNYIYVGTFHGCMDVCALDRSQGIVVADVAGTCLSVTWVSASVDFGTCYMKNSTALIGSSNKTAQMTHAVPSAQAGLQSASIEGDY